jgi:hypothetical protein
MAAVLTVDLREYRDNQRTASGRTAGRHPWELVRPDIIRRLLPAAVTPDTSGLILDLGCGDAFVVEALSHAYPAATFAAVDVELDDELMAAIGSTLVGRRIRLYRSLDSVNDQEDRRAEVVLLLDVIEHIEDDIGFLRALRQTPLVGPATRVLITVPAYQRLFSTHDRLLGHYRRYDPHMLVDHLTRAGYDVDDAGAYFGSALLFRVAQLLRERWGGAPAVTTDVAAWHGGPVLTMLIRWMLWVDFGCSRLLHRAGIRLPGLSHYALCRPSAS